MHTVFIHVYSCSSLLCTFCFCRVYVSGISSSPVHPVFFSLNKSVQFSSVQEEHCRRERSAYQAPGTVRGPGSSTAVTVCETTLRQSRAGNELR